MGPEPLRGSRTAAAGAAPHTAEGVTSVELVSPATGPRRRVEGSEEWVGVVPGRVAEWCIYVEPVGTGGFPMECVAARRGELLTSERPPSRPKA